MAARKVPVTSVTPASKVKATSKAQQSRTRNLVMGIAAATPVGRAAKAAGTAAKAASGARKTSTVAQANARGLKAANKPTNKVGSKADKEIRSRTKSVVMSKEETKASYDYYYGKGSGEGITQINKSVTPRNEASSVRKSPVKLNKKK
jgi:hypothetical protein